MSCSFHFIWIFNSHTKGIGKTSSTTSMQTLIAPKDMAATVTLMHQPLTLGLHKALTGRQEKTERKICRM